MGGAIPTPDYKTMYFELSGKVADAIELLIQAQKEGEQSYCESPPVPVILEEHLPDQKNEQGEQA